MWPFQKIRTRKKCFRIEHTFAASRQPKRRQRPDDAEYILGEEGANFSLGRIWTMDGEFRPRGSHNLLLLGPCKLTQNRLGDRSRGLDGERVHKHRRRGRHAGGLRDGEPGYVYIQAE